jgi:hypothetical protein
MPEMYEKRNSKKPNRINNLRAPPKTSYKPIAAVLKTGGNRYGLGLKWLQMGY